MHERNAKPRRVGPVVFEPRQDSEITPRYLCGLPKRRPPSTAASVTASDITGDMIEGYRPKNGGFSEARANRAMLPEDF